MGFDQHEHEHGHGHAHSAPTVSSRATRLTLAVLIPAALATVAGLLMLWPAPMAALPDDGPASYSGTVTRIVHESCPPASEDPSGTVARTVCGTVEVRLQEGPDAGKLITTTLPSGKTAPMLSPGDDVVVMQTQPAEGTGAAAYDVIDHDRGSQLWLLIAVFALAVIAFGRLRGLTALIGLAFTFLMLLSFIVPAILQGESPLLVAIVGSAAIMLVVLYLTHGFSTATSMAVLGTLASLALTGAMAWAAASALHMTGDATEEAAFLSMQYGKVNLLGLLLAGIIIGALGVLDDVTVTQAYTVAELARANPTLGFADLYRAASRVGRAHITSVINTIVLAYAGASLPLLLLLSGGPWLEMIKSEQLAAEIVRSIVGTLGLIAAVPITTALAAATVAGRAVQKIPAGRRRRPDPLETAWSIDESHPGGYPPPVASNPRGVPGR